MAIELIPGYDRAEEVRELFTEYTDMLVELDPVFKTYLGIQHYDEEISNLEGKYGMPGGRLYLLYVDGALAGSIALRRMDAERCEMKRLYVRPGFRGQHLSDILIERIMQDARDVGYKHMLLDTLPMLESAVYIYRKMGFYDIPCYNDSPMDNTIFLQYDL